MSKLNKRLSTISESAEIKKPSAHKKRPKSSMDEVGCNTMVMREDKNINKSARQTSPKQQYPKSPLIKVKKSISANDLLKHKPVTKRRIKSSTELVKKVKEEPVKKAKSKSPSRKPSLVRTFIQRRPVVEKTEDAKQRNSKRNTEWDYKTRFSLLSEKYAILLQSYKDAKQKLIVFDSTERQLNWLQDHFNGKEHKINELLIENKQLRHHIGELEEIYAQHKDLKNNYNILLENYETSLKIIEDLKSELNNLRQTKLDLTKKCSCYEQENSTLREGILSYGKIRRELHNTIQELKGNIRVFCRVRPPANAIELRKPACCINFIDDKGIEIMKSKPSLSGGRPTEVRNDFMFDKVFPPDTSQYVVFEELAELVQSALDGYDVCIFAYGQTGSGKTYTMQGNNTAEGLGIIPRTIDLIFNSIQNLEQLGWIYTVKATFLEIYNEAIIDLLNPDNKGAKEIRSNEGKGLVVTNVTVKTISSAQEFKELMIIAQNKRVMAATDANEHSSRSHAVTRIELKGVHRAIRLIYCGSINLVDLAGSETAKIGSNQRLSETRNINRSLANLGSVILALHRNEAHVPYRNSKLTYLLQSSLGGNSKTLMIVNMLPFDESYYESLNSLRFAATVKEIRTFVKRNKSSIKL